jgi:hypothetical protein
MKFPLKPVVAALAIVTATPSIAALTLVPGGTCSISTPDPDASACAGAYAGNLNNTARQGDLNIALDALVGGSFSPDVVFTNIEGAGSLFTLVGTDTLQFSQTLFGQQIISAHFGNAGTGLGDRTILYLFNFGTTGANSITLGTNGFSNAVLITPVPEPATWAMMLLGMGAIGLTLRSRRRKSRLLQTA